MPQYKALSPAQVSQFLDDGFIILRNTIPREIAAPILRKVWASAGADPDDRSTWTKPVVHIKEVMKCAESDAAYTPFLVDAMDDLMGHGRWTLNKHLGWWPITFPGHHAPPWQRPTVGWHVDGSWFHHHVHSREQGLLTLHLYSDIDPGGGGTAIIPGSHKWVARMLAKHEPAGCTDPQAQSTGFGEYVQENLHRAIEVTGQVGDVGLMHPFMMHSVSANTGSRPRIICNPCQSLTEHMNFHRTDPDEYSPVERAIVDAARDLLENVAARV
ncbi:MAG: phytanoyl-CoA dioxygenase family protein [Planctomycetota bacterium]|nr:phytanoyl-CoA dioxygenase family protein [Planctomycetota bacterium]